MAEVDGPTVPHVCFTFESQTWRKSLCKNCFHTLEEHSEELLAKEAEAVAKEKAAGKISAPGTKKPAVTNAKNASSVDAKNVKRTGSSRELDNEKEKSPKDVKGKITAKDSSKECGKVSLTKDVARENKTTKPGTLSKTTNEKHPTSTTTSGSSLLSPTISTVKSPLKNIKSTTATASSAQTTTTTSITPATSGTNSTSNPQKTSVSKPRNSSSTIEPKTPVSSKDKLSKPPDTPTKNSNILTNNAKSTNNVSSSKLSDRSMDPTQSSLSRSDLKSPRKIAEESKLTETASKNAKTGISKVLSTKPVDVKNENCSSDASKEAKTPPLAIKPDSKDTKTSLLTIKPDSKDTKSSPLTSKPDSKDTKSSPLTSKPDNKDAKTLLLSNKSDNKDAKMPPLATKPDSKVAKTSPLANKPDSKDLKLVNGTSSKTPLFNKDSIKSVKDATKQIKSSDSGENKTNSSQTKDNGITNINDSSKDTTITTTEKVKVITGSKYSPVKLSDKGKQQESESTTLRGSTKLKCAETSLESSTNEHKSSTTSNHDTAELDKPGLLVKATTKNSETNMSGNPENKETAKTTMGSSGSKRESSPFSSPSKTEDKCVSSRDRGKEKSIERKQELVADSSIAGKKVLSSLPSTQSSRSATPSSTDNKSSSLALSTKVADNKTSKTLKLDSSKETKSPMISLDKSRVSEKMKDKSGDKGTSILSVKSPTFPPTQTPKTIEESKEGDKEPPPKKQPVDAKDATRLTAELKDKERKLQALTEQLSKMVQQVKALEEERDHIKGISTNNHKKDTEALLISLREQLSNLESHSRSLETDNQSLIDQLHAQEATVKKDQESRDENLNNVNLEEDLEAAEKELEDVKEVNKELQTQIMDMKCEMDELYDHFRENEHEEFRELQKELDMTAKTCRILQFKLRKSERRNEQFEEERMRYEEKLRTLQDQFDSKDAKNHIRILEEELRIAKEVSVRLHDELDIVEDKRNNALDDNRHLTDLLEHTDRRQFRLEMEIDKLRDIVSELKQQLAEAKSRNTENKNYNKELSPDEKVPSSIYTRSID